MAGQDGDRGCHVEASQPLLPSDGPIRSLSPSTLGSPPSSPTLSSTSSDRRRQRRSAASTRYVAFATALIATLFGGSITAFSLYGHILQERLHYSLYQVNGLAAAASFAMYFLCPFVGYICDRRGPAPLYLASGILFAFGYGLAAGLYRRALETRRDPEDWQYVLMIVAFGCIGLATSSMYIPSLSTCAKNFGKSKFRGVILNLPNAGFGLSAMFLSQFSSKVLYDHLPDGVRGDVNVFALFLMLAVVLFTIGCIGFFTMRVVNEDDLIDEAVEQLERSGLLDGSALLTPGRPRTPGRYGTMERDNPFDDEVVDVANNAILTASKDLEEDDAKFKKNFVLNAETRRFLGDPTMWFLALSFFFSTGPGEAFINNLGTVIKSLNPPLTTTYGTLITSDNGARASPATQISIASLLSTLIRFLSGILTDLLAPTPHTAHLQIPGSHHASHFSPTTPPPRFKISRITFLVLFDIFALLGFAILASGWVQNHGERFTVVSALVGAGQGAMFSLTPLIITIIWGVENFATNFGVVAVFPAIGNLLWGFVYSAVYQGGAVDEAEKGRELFCHGVQCYAPAFWGMAGSVGLACLLLLWAWKGRNGWAQRGIVI